MLSIWTTLPLEALLLFAVLICSYAGFKVLDRRHRFFLLSLGAFLACQGAFLLSFAPIRTNQRLGLLLFAIFVLGQGTAWLMLRERITKPALAGGFLVLAGTLFLAICG